LKIKKERLLKNHIIEFENAESFSNTITLTKNQIEHLSMDSTVASIEEYVTPQTLDCSALPGGAQDFKSLANSA
jgi:hypothetical protein